MSAGRDVERLIAEWLEEEAPGRAPDRILESAAQIIDRTRQRRFGAAWRQSMNVKTRSILAAAAVGAVLIGGATIFLKGVPSSGIGGPASPAPSLTASPGAPATASPGASVITSPSPSTGLIAGACDLVSNAEASTALGSLGLGAKSAQSTQGAVTTCRFTNASDENILTLTYRNPGGRVAFDAARGRTGVRTVADIGTDAAYDPVAATLYVVKGDALVTIVSDRGIPEPELGKLVAGRL